MEAIVWPCADAPAGIRRAFRPAAVFALSVCICFLVWAGAQHCLLQRVQLCVCIGVDCASPAGAQVLRKDYAHAADVWSAGVIMFILLSGYPPFTGSSDARILQRVQQGTYSFGAKEVRARCAKGPAVGRSRLPAHDILFVL